MATNRLYRDTEHAMLGGVCAGIANRFDTDPTLVRIATIVIALVTAAVPVSLIYLALWIIMPAGSAEATTHRASRNELTDEFRGAGGRVTEAARILGRSAKQAATEINELQRRPTAPPPVGDEAAGAQAVNEDVLSGEEQPRESESQPSWQSPPSESPSTPSMSAPPPPPPPAPPTGPEGDQGQRPPQP